MTITKEELKIEADSLQEFGLTSEEIEGYLEFYKDSFIIEEPKHKKIRILNTRKRLIK